MNLNEHVAKYMMIVGCCYISSWMQYDKSFHPMVLYENHLINIFMNMYENLKMMNNHGRTWGSLKVKSMQRPGTVAIRTQTQPSKPKRVITKITNSQNTKRKYGQPTLNIGP